MIAVARCKEAVARCRPTTQQGELLRDSSSALQLLSWRQGMHWHDQHEGGGGAVIQEQATRQHQQWQQRATRQQLTAWVPPTQNSLPQQPAVPYSLVESRLAEVQTGLGGDENPACRTRGKIISFTAWCCKYSLRASRTARASGQREYLGHALVFYLTQCPNVCHYQIRRRPCTCCTHLRSSRECNHSQSEVQKRGQGASRRSSVLLEAVTATLTVVISTRNAINVL